MRSSTEEYVLKQKIFFVYLIFLELLFQDKMLPTNNLRMHLFKFENTPVLFEMVRFLICYLFIYYFLFLECPKKTTIISTLSLIIPVYMIMLKVQDFLTLTLYTYLYTYLYKNINILMYNIISRFNMKKEQR